MVYSTAANFINSIVYNVYHYIVVYVTVYDIMLYVTVC